MDRSWINSRRTNVEYENGVQEFLEFAQKNLPDSNNKFYCSCVKCINLRQLHVELIREHLFCDGFCKSYTEWIRHGESVEMPSMSSHKEKVRGDTYDHMDDMIRDFGVESFARAHSYISTRLNEGGKQCYLALYYYQNRWQLFILSPVQNTIVFLSSLGNKPNRQFKNIIDAAMEAS
ncbi:unnamed protein product [Cuscuta europaea]|uniref:Transposase-associated domain-containing protein n=1 Tax=Cuscuta europaea TaxID=41803 RepID=A0A9P0YX02_CUSEU|nr:unnamed protein product [Cuscuta europaea]